MNIISSMPTKTAKITMFSILLLAVGIFFLPEWRYMAFVSSVQFTFEIPLLQEVILMMLLSWPGLLICLVSMVRHYRRAEEKLTSAKSDLNVFQARELLDEYDRAAFGIAQKQLPHPLDGWRDHDFQ